MCHNGIDGMHLGGIKHTVRQVIIIYVLVHVHLAMLLCIIYNVILWYSL